MRFYLRFLIRFSGVAKIAFHFTNKVHPIVPECCLLICLGLIVGGMVYAYKDNVRILEIENLIHQNWFRLVELALTWNHYSPLTHFS